MAKRQDDVKPRYQFPKYSVVELKIFADELIKYKGDKGYLSVIDETQFLKDKGALSKNNSVIVSGWCYKKNNIGEMYPVCDYPSLYETLMNKLDQYYESLRKVDYAKNMDLKSLEKSVINQYNV